MIDATTLKRMVTVACANKSRAHIEAWVAWTKTRYGWKRRVAIREAVCYELGLRDHRISDVTATHYPEFVRLP